MLGVTTPWTLAILMLFGIAVTLVTDWLAGGRGRLSLPGRLGAASVTRLIAEMFWVLLVFAAGIIAVRYMERIPFELVGWLSFAGLAFVVSFVRARLYCRIQVEQIESCVRGAAHLLVYLLAASSAYLLICLAGEQTAVPILFVPLWLGALLPDLDSTRSPLGRLLPWVSQRLEARLGSCGKWHSLAANILLALVTTPLIFLVGWRTWALTPLGFFVHLLIDVWRPRGIPLFWPVSRVRVCVGGKLAPGGVGEKVLCAVLAIAAVILLLTVDVGRPVALPTPTPTYEQTVDRYYALRGRSLVYAWLEGSWQTTGRRIRGNFEILNVVGETFIVLDRYDGTVFTAGRSSSDELYVNRILLSEGAPARIKPAQVHLKAQAFRDALPVLYEMQNEPGLQHIYVSGDLVVPESGEFDGTALPMDLGQMRLRRVEDHGDGHFTVRYLTASQLIGLANLYVETADMVITATYETPASGPTVTPLPSPPPQTEGGQ